MIRGDVHEGAINTTVVASNEELSSNV